MTEARKRDALETYCDNHCCEYKLHDERPTCIFDGKKDAWCVKYNEYNIPLDKLDEVLKTIEESTKDTTNDVINHPKHYCREGGMESIDEMVMLFGKEAVMNFCLCNVWKYRYRAADKNGIEDLEKSDWYIQKYKELQNESAV